jgi:hypothetical protein
MKKVLLVVIDALASRVIQPAMDAGRLPHLKALADAGWVDWRSISIFPSITPAATAAIVTGGYPSETGIAGAYFYDRVDENVHYYGDDFWPIMREGFGAFFEDFLVHLNRDQLRIETLYEAVERTGRKAACLNYLWFRGGQTHKVRVPWTLRLVPGVPFSKKIGGPTFLSLGDFVSSRIESTGEKLQGSGGLKHRFGFDDQTTSELLLRLVRSDVFPALTVAYFPDNDYDSHEHGPANAVETVENVDRVLGEVIAARGGIERLLEEAAVIVTGDHSQDDLVHDEDDTEIHLDEVLSNFELAATGANWDSDDQLMVCPNMRSTQIYLREAMGVRRDEVIAALLADPKVDQVMWRTSGDDAGETRYCVATRDRGRLEFWLTQDASSAMARDEYGASWSWSGDLAAVDGEVNGDGVLRFEAYPNAFERIVTGFDWEVSGDIWTTSRPGYEFRRNGTSIHRGGSHGSLHAIDSLSPLIVAGAPRPPDWRQTPRSVDVAPLCRQVLDLPVVHPLGASHVTPP